MRKETISDLIWKMECKGFKSSDIHFFLDVIWLLNSNAPFLMSPNRFKKDQGGYLHDYDSRLAQAHVEIDFTNYRK